MQEARELSAMRTETHFIGKRLKRIEDTRLLSGEARFLDDIQLPDMMYAVFVRSTYAHARINKISTDIAKKVSGVYGIFTAKELSDTIIQDRLPLAFPRFDWNSNIR